MNLKIVVDENIPLAEKFFSPMGQLIRLPGRTLQAADVDDADALIVRSVTPVNEALLSNSRVKFVGTCTIGTDHLDLDYLRKRGIAYSSAPGCNANSVVEYVFSALCALGVDWRHKTVGIVGCGNVGGYLYRRLLDQGVDCRCYDPFLSIEQNADLTSLNSVLDSDIVCLHTPLTTAGPYPSLHLLGTSELNRLKAGAVLLNAGRGGVINNRDLLSFLQRRKDVRVVLDVWEGEPNIDTELMDRVDLASPHIAGYSFDGKVAGTEMIYRAMCDQFGLKAELSASDLLNSGKSVLQSSPGLQGFERWRELVLSAYDVRGDDARMRALLAAASGEALASRFDQLRKLYPERREFSHFLLEAESELLEGLNKELLEEQDKQIEKKPHNNMLATLGFCTGFTNIENRCKHSKNSHP